MPLCCIGGVCVPYTAVVPFFVLGLQWLFQKLVSLGVVPQSVQDKLHALLNGRKSSVSTKTAAVDGSVDQKKRRKATVKASESCCSTAASSSSCCDSDDQKQQPTTTTDRSSSSESADRSSSESAGGGVVKVIESEEDWKSFVGETSGGLVVVKMTATWCQPCKVIQPYYEQLAASCASGGSYISCAIVDVDELDQVAAQFRVAALPTFLAVQNNAVVQRYSGSNEAQLQNFFQKIKEEFQ